MIVLQREILSSGDTEASTDAANLVRYHLKPGTYSVGRNQAKSSICLLGDESISRNHAAVTVFGLTDERAHNDQVAVLQGKLNDCKNLQNKPP